jgi:hypothetical protein
MANTNSPFGFSVMDRVPGSPSPDFAQTKRLISSSDTNKIFFGDVVQDLGTGYIGVATAGLTQVYGVFVGCEYTSTSLQKVVWSRYWPGADATGDVTAYVCTDPYALFNVQSSSTAITAASIGANIDISTGTAGNTTTGVSGMAVNPGTIDVTATLPFRIWALTSSQYPLGISGNVNGIDDTSSYNQVLVTFNSMALKTLTGL